MRKLFPRKVSSNSWEDDLQAKGGLMFSEATKEDLRHRDDHSLGSGESPTPFLGMVSVAAVDHGVKFGSTEKEGTLSAIGVDNLDATPSTVVPQRKFWTRNTIILVILLLFFMISGVMGGLAFSREGGGTVIVTLSPSLSPTQVEERVPSNVPSSSPINSPSQIPTIAPSSDKTEVPSTSEPTMLPTSTTSGNPVIAPTITPSPAEDLFPTAIPTVGNPTVEATTKAPSVLPSSAPTNVPSSNPTTFPSLNPTISPTTFPTLNPTISPTSFPSLDPTVSPTPIPSQGPTTGIIPSVTVFPTNSPTSFPTTNSPTSFPTNIPTPFPTTTAPTLFPTTDSPTPFPTNNPTPFPTTAAPTLFPIAIDDPCSLATSAESKYCIDENTLGFCEEVVADNGELVVLASQRIKRCDVEEEERIFCRCPDGLPFDFTFGCVFPRNVDTFCFGSSESILEEDYLQSEELY